MSLTTNEMTPADIAAVTGNNNGFMGGEGAWWIIILFLFAFMGNGWGNGFSGGGNQGAADNYVLASDFATIQRQLSDGFGMVERKGDSISNGLCDGFYAQNTTMLNGFNGVNAAVTQAQIADMQGFNALQAQLAQCCCDNRAATADLKYTVAQTGADISRQTERGFCDTNYALATNTTAIVQNAHTDTDRIIARIDAMENARQAERIAQLQSDNQALKFAASQAEQNQYLVAQLKPCPVPAFLTCNPSGPLNYSVNHCGCGCGA